MGLVGQFEAHGFGATAFLVLDDSARRDAVHSLHTTFAIFHFVVNLNIALIIDRYEHGEHRERILGCARPGGLAFEGARNAFILCLSVPECKLVMKTYIVAVEYILFVIVLGIPTIEVESTAVAGRTVGISIPSKAFCLVNLTSVVGVVDTLKRLFMEPVLDDQQASGENEELTWASAWAAHPARRVTVATRMMKN